jgi:excisionase family DNA binding protein
MPFHPHQPSRGRRSRTEPDQHIPARVNASEGAAPVLYTPAEAAQLLKVRESWLRKKAAARQVPCTFLGKHLRFSPADVAAIITAAAQPPVGRRPRRRAPTLRDRDLPPGRSQSVHPPDTDDHIRDGSSPWPG